MSKDILFVLRFSRLEFNLWHRISRISRVVCWRVSIVSTKTTIAIFKMNAFHRSVWQISAGPRQHSRSWSRVPPEWRPYFTISRFWESWNSSAPLRSSGIPYILVIYLVVGGSSNHDFPAYSSLSTRCIQKLPRSPKHLNPEDGNCNIHRTLKKT
jgi:hypothetical protein